MYTYEIVSNGQEGYRDIIRKLGEQGYRVINVSATHVTGTYGNTGSVYWTLERTQQPGAYR